MEEENDKDGAAMVKKATVKMNTKLLILTECDKREERGCTMMMAFTCCHGEKK